MNLSQLMRLEAGGPGSGCNGPRCGRPATGRKSQTRQLIKKLHRQQPDQKTSHRTIPLGVTRRGGKEHIKIKDPRQYRVKMSWKSPQGHKVSVMQPKGQKSARNADWVRKASLMKGGFKMDHNLTDMSGQTKVGIFTATKPNGDATTVAIMRNPSTQRLQVKEIDTKEYGAIARTRVVEFNNMGRGFGFLNMRYGIRFSAAQNRL